MQLSRCETHEPAQLDVAHLRHVPVDRLRRHRAVHQHYNGGNVTSAGWQVTLCDPMWHVSSRSGVATLRTAIHLLHLLLLTYCGRAIIAVCAGIMVRPHRTHTL